MKELEELEPAGYIFTPGECDPEDVIESMEAEDDRERENKDQRRS